jgi:DNA-binding beta-propeller fold protein YncE
MTPSFRPSSSGCGASSDPIRPRRRRRALAAAGAALATGLAGCGRPAGIVFEPLAEPVRWPAPPDPARIEYVGQLVTSDDLKPAKSFGQLLGESLFGRKASRSMLSPYAVCTDGGARVFVGDSNAQVVHVFDLESRTYAQWTPAAAGAEFSQPVGVAYDRPGRRLLVADSVAGCIFVFAGDGTCLGAIGDGLLDRPCGVAVDPDSGRVFVADAAAHQVVVLDEGGKLLERVGGRGVAPGRFNFPTNVALDAAGRMYVADTLNFRVQVFDRDLRPVGQIGSAGDLPGYFSQPKGVALDREGHVYVVDAHFESVQIFDAEGQVLMTFGREGTGPGEFWLPAGIHIDPSGRIWIADSYNRRVQVFQYLPGAE